MQSLSRGRPTHDGSVLVAVRVRPLVPREVSDVGPSVIMPNDGVTLTVTLPRKSGRDAWGITDAEAKYDKRQYAFDEVFGPEASQEEIYRAVGAPIIKHAHAGFNCSVIAYGQTGSGKTYTVMGPFGGRMSGNAYECSASDGIIPRLCLDLFNPRNHFVDDQKQQVYHN